MILPPFKPCLYLNNGLKDGELSMEERWQLISTATNAVTLGDRPALVADLRAESAPARLRVASRRRNSALGPSCGTDPTTPGALSLSGLCLRDYGGSYIVFADDGTSHRLNLL